MAAKIEDRWSVIQSNFYQQSYSYDLGANRQDLFYVAIPRIPVSPKSGWMRLGYSYYEPKYPIQVIDGIEYTQGLCIVDEFLRSNKAIFYVGQTANVDYTIPYVSRRNNLQISTPPDFKTLVRQVVSAYTANITTISLHTDTTLIAYMNTICLSFPVEHAPLYFLLDRWATNLNAIYRLPNTYPILLYWW